MPLLTLKDAHLAYGTQVLLEKEAMTIDSGDIIGLLGRNGVGKTSLLKILLGDVKPDSGERWLSPGLRIATLEQELPCHAEETVYEFIAGGLDNVGRLLSDYHQLTALSDASLDMKKLERLQHEIDAIDGWKIQQKVETVISQLELPTDSLMSSLSGGWSRRAALARALVVEPDILLLDEPTNHLDIPAIEWLEKFMGEFRGTLIFVSHDREFVSSLPTPIIELTPNGIVPLPWHL